MKSDDILRIFDFALFSLGYLLLISFFIALIGFGMLFLVRIGWLSKTRKGMGLILFLQVFIGGALTLGVQSWMNLQVRESIKSMLQETDLEIKINGFPVQDAIATRIKNDFETLTYRGFSKKHFSTDIEMTILTTSDTFPLVLKRDFPNSHEYVIHLKKYTEIRDFEIGMVTTKAFDHLH